MIVSIDYLTLYVQMSNRRKIDGFEFKLQKYNSKHFAKIAHIYIYGEKVANLEYQPHSSILDSRAGLLKIENNILYQKDMFHIVDLIMDYIGAKVISISRLDICADFEKFKNNLEPKKLIKNFMTERYLRNGRGKYTIIGNQKNVQDVEYLRFGSKSSAVNVYLYNKSIEMEDVKHKAHIAELWKQNNLGKDNQVWRLEVSLKSEAMTYVDDETGEYFKVNLEHLKDNKFIEKLYYSLVQKYFEFRKNDKTKNKSRMQKVDLFNQDEMTYKRIKITNEPDYTRRDKVLLKNMYLYEKRYPNATNIAKLASSQIERDLKNSDYLYKYFMKKKQLWDEEED